MSQPNTHPLHPTSCSFLPAKKKKKKHLAAPVRPWSRTPFWHALPRFRLGKPRLSCSPAPFSLFLWWLPHKKWSPKGVPFCRHILGKEAAEKGSLFLGSPHNSTSCPSLLPPAASEGALAELETSSQEAEQLAAAVADKRLSFQLASELVFW